MSAADLFTTPAPIHGEPQAPRFVAPRAAAKAATSAEAFAALIDDAERGLIEGGHIRADWRANIEEPRT